MAEQKFSFLLPHLGQLQNLANWPNADVIKTALITELIPELCGVPYDYLFRDNAEAMAECTCLVHEFIGIDLLIANMDVYNFEGEAMGAKLNFFKDHCPDFNRSSYFIQGREDFEKIRFGGLDTGRFPYLLEYCQRYQEYTGIPTFPTFSAPWTLAGNLYGLDNLVMDTMEDPEFVQDLLCKIVDDFQIPMFKAFREVHPFMAEMSLVDAFVTIPMVNPDIVDKFVRPSLQRLIDGVCTNGEPFLDTAFFGQSKLNKNDLKRFEDFITWSNGRFFCSDPDAAILTPEYARRRADECLLPLQTGVDAALIEFGSKEAIIEKVKHYTLAGKNGLTPCIFFFNNFTPRTPIKNIQIAMQTLRIYGAPGATSETVYEDPEFITFPEFLKNKMRNNPEGYQFRWLENSRLRNELQ